MGNLCIGGRLPQTYLPADKPAEPAARPRESRAPRASRGGAPSDTVTTPARVIELEPIVVHARSPGPKWRPAPSLAEVDVGGVVRRGHHGPAVRALQEKLRRAGHDIEVDGLFGPRTERALRAYQATHGLGVDGKFGPESAAELFAPPGPPPSDPPAPRLASDAPAREVDRASLSSAERYAHLAPAGAQRLLEASAAVLAALDGLFRSPAYGAMSPQKRRDLLQEILREPSEAGRLALLEPYAPVKNDETPRPANRRGVS